MLKFNELVVGKMYLVSKHQVLKAISPQTPKSSLCLLRSEAEMMWTDAQTCYVIREGDKILLLEKHLKKRAQKTFKVVDDQGWLKVLIVGSDEIGWMFLFTEGSPSISWGFYFHDIDVWEAK